MYSLFWKIFLTYWLIILIIELFTVWFTANVSESEIHATLEQQNQQFIVDSNRAVEIIETQGLDGLQAWMAEESNRQAIEDIFVINQNREEVNNKQLPSEVYEIAQGTPGDLQQGKEIQPVKRLLTLTATTPGDTYLVISTFRRPSVVSYLLAPQRVAVGVIVSGLICLLLARYFTQPLSNLRRSTQLLTAGEFNTASIQSLRKRRDEFGALAVDFEVMSDRLNELLSAKRQLLRDISHELRSPLARIRVALGLARNKHGFGDCSDLDRIEREIERFELLIGELLVFARIRSSDDLVSMSNVDVRGLLAEIVGDAKYEGQRADEKCQISLDCPEGIEVEADAHLLYRAIENIARNALKYSPQQASVQISCKVHGETVVIDIEDNGPGVPGEMLERIFQPFVRVSSARESETGGSGIGLAIAQRVIEIHNGAVSAHNKNEGSGLVVTVTLPLYCEIRQRSAA
jgi:two-component system sensor histidine kinase CpxA